MPIINSYKIALIIFFIDQISKYYVVYKLNLVEIIRMDAVLPFVNFRMAWNQGVNFGLLGSDGFATRAILIIISLVICVGLTWWFRNNQSRFIQLSLGFIIGGAIGNAFDRILHGAVADFLNITCCNITNPFSSNYR